MRSFVSTLVLVALCGCASVAETPLRPMGFAAMGDSLTAGTSVETTWVPFLSRSRGFHFGGEGEPYNAAVGGSSSMRLLRQGQHLRVRDWVASGEVDFVYLVIGANDFVELAGRIAQGHLHGEKLDRYIDRIVANITRAIDEVRSAGPRGLFVAEIPDLSRTPHFKAQFSHALEGERVSAAIDRANLRIRRMARERGLPTIDMAGLGRDFSDVPIEVGGIRVDFTTPDRTSSASFFQDGVHPSVLGNGIIANLMLTALELAYEHPVRLFSDREVLETADLGDRYAGETFPARSSLARYVNLPH